MNLNDGLLLTMRSCVSDMKGCGVIVTTIKITGDCNGLRSKVDQVAGRYFTTAFFHLCPINVAQLQIPR